MLRASNNYKSFPVAVAAWSLPFLSQLNVLYFC